MVDLRERLEILFPDIYFGDLPNLGDCFITKDKIITWDRTEPQPTEQELSAITQEQIDNFKISEKKKQLSTRIVNECTSRIYQFVDRDQVLRAINEGALYTTKKADGDITPEEETKRLYLKQLSQESADDRAAQDQIILELDGKTLQELELIDDAWIKNHPRWPV